MNTQRLATLRISALHVQQALFATLALMVTLIVVQQFSHWSQAQQALQAAQIRSTYHHSAPFAKEAALKASDVMQRLQPVDDAQASVDQAPRQQSWVF